MKVLCIA